MLLLSPWAGYCLDTTWILPGYCQYCRCSADEAVQLAQMQHSAADSVAVYSADADADAAAAAAAPSAMFNCLKHIHKHGTLHFFSLLQKCTIAGLVGRRSIAQRC